jgi:hypothetical protein
MASPNLSKRIADLLVDQFPNLTLKIVEDAIEASDDMDQKGTLFAIRSDLRALGATEGKDK